MRSQVLSKQDKSFSHLNSVQEEKKGPAETSQEKFLFPRYKKKIKSIQLNRKFILQFLLQLTHLDYLGDGKFLVIQYPKFNKDIDERDKN